MILNLNKPVGISSHSVVNQVRRITGERRVGHGGTLDPLAKGVLIVGVGRESTRKLQELLKNVDKEYVATIELGKSSPTDDSEGLLQVTGIVSGITVSSIKKTLKEFTGEIKQRPPKYSAIKINGSPAYKLARQGKEFEIPQKSVHIKNIDLLDFNPPCITIKTTVSSGTYIRSLARDIGAHLGVGGYLKELTRTRVGQFTLDKSTSIEDLSRQYKT